MKVLVCGGRDFSDRNLVFAVLDEIAAKNPIDHLIEGGASGADQAAADWAMGEGVTLTTVLADWRGNRKAAGPIRNRQMAEMKPDLVVAFPGGRGTANMVKQARERGLEVFIVGEKQ